MFLHVLAGVFALAIAAGASGFESPSEDLLHQLQKLNHARPWIRVTTDSSRLTLRAGRIDASGLSELSSRRSDPPAPHDIAWRSIARIDGPGLRQNSGKVGAIVLGGLGVALAAAGGDGPALVGLAVVSGGVGALRAGVFTAKERLWYAGTPAASPPAAMQVPESTSTVATQAPESTSVSTPSVTVADTSAALAVRPASADTSRSPRVLRARARIKNHELIRMRSVFGDFQGFAATVGPRGMEGLSTDPRRHRKFQDAAPSGLVLWEQIDFVEHKETSFGRGALGAGAALFASVGLLSLMIGGFAIAAGGQDVDPIHWALVGGSVAGAIGVVVGGSIGASVPSWHKVYERP